MQRREIDRRRRRLGGDSFVERGEGGGGWGSINLHIGERGWKRRRRR